MALCGTLASLTPALSLGEGEGERFTALTQGAQTVRPYAATYGREGGHTGPPLRRVVGSIVGQERNSAKRVMALCGTLASLTPALSLGEGEGERFTALTQGAQTGRPYTANYGR
jgi:hypothetical protein